MGIPCDPKQTVSFEELLMSQNGKVARIRDRQAGRPQELCPDYQAAAESRVGGPATDVCLPWQGEGQDREGGQQAQAVIVVNKPGGETLLGTDVVSKLEKGGIFLWRKWQ